MHARAAHARGITHLVAAVALDTVVVGLLAVMAAAGYGAVLGGRVLLEARRHDAVKLLVLSTMRNNLKKNKSMR